MKKFLLQALLFIVAFCGAYVACCYFIPGWRIKLEADPFTYFVQSVTHMVFVKALISLVISVLACAVSVVIGKKK